MKGVLIFILILTLTLGSSQPETTEEVQLTTEISEDIVSGTTTADVASKEISESSLSPLQDTTAEPSLQEARTESSSETEANLSPNQAAVLRELNEIWDYSAGLNETTDGELKTTLSSVVQLAYARLHAEPDDTLHRLKYLLEKLRQRIGVSHRQTVIHIKGGNDNDDSSRLPNDRKIMPASRKKRGATYGIAEIERIDDDNSIYSNLLSYVKNRPVLDSSSSISSGEVPTVTPPGDKTIHKILLVQGENESRFPTKVISNRWKIKKTTTTSAPPPSKPTMFYPPINLPTNSLSSIGPSYSTENEIEPQADEPSVEHIANAIVQLLYPLQNQSESPPQPNHPQEFKFPDHKHLFEHKLAIARNQSAESLNLTSTETVNDELPVVTTTTTSPLFQALNFNTNATELHAAQDKLVNLKTEADNQQQSSTSTTTHGPAVLHIVNEINSSNILKAPAAFINGTRDGFVQFVTTLSTLSFATKMVIIFAISISILSIVLGVYSLGPPIIAVGVLGIMIPICILLLLQDGAKISSKNPNRNDSPQGKINWNDQITFILDVIEEAVKKYGDELHPK